MKKKTIYINTNIYIYITSGIFSLQYTLKHVLNSLYIGKHPQLDRYGYLIFSEIKNELTFNWLESNCGFGESPISHLMYI